MDMEDFLERGGAVSQKQVYPFTLKTGLPQSGGEAHGHLKHVGAGFGSEVGEVIRVGSRDHKDVTWVHGLNIHEREDGGIGVDEAGRVDAVNDATEAALSQCDDSSPVAW
jgi:hypothetical protein